MKRASAITFLLLGATAAPAVETELTLGPNEMVLGAELASQHITRGREYADEPSAHFHGRGRFSYVGLSVDAWMPITEDEANDVDGGEITELTFRADGLIELPRTRFPFGLQLLPHYETTFFPNVGTTEAEEPHWLGVDGWLMLPWEGMEVGGSVEYDLGEEWGWNGSVAARQMIQYAPLDVLLYQELNFGDEDYHRFLTGSEPAPDPLDLGDPTLVAAGFFFAQNNPLLVNQFTGNPAFLAATLAYLESQQEDGPGDDFTTFRLGGRVTTPLPWENFWAVLRLETQWWVNGDDRKLIEDTFELVIGAGFEFRFQP